MAFLTFHSSLLEEMSSKPTYCIFIACTNTVLNKHWVSFRRCHIKKRIIIPVCRVSLLRLLVSSVTVRNVHSEMHEIAGREGGRGGEEGMLAHQYEWFSSENSTSVDIECC